MSLEFVFNFQSNLSLAMRSFLYLSLVGIISAYPALPVRPNSRGDMTILCTSEQDDSTGFCASEQYCADGNGRSIGSCDSGGVCCKIESSCASTTTFPVTYFTSPSYPDSDSMDVSCNLNIQTRGKVCQLRVDFVDFEIPGPTHDGRCQANNVFKIFAPSSPRGILGGDEQVGLCGLNEGQHLYIPVDPSDVVQLHFTLSGTGTVPNSRVASLSSQTSYKWNLKITQVECGGDNEAMARLEAPSGCLQYFRDNYGTISSFNMDGSSRFSPSQDYNICLNKQEDDTRKACGIEIRAQKFGLPVDDTDGAEDGELVGDKPECQLGDRLVNTRTDPMTQCCIAPLSASLALVGIDQNVVGNNLRYHFCGERLGSTNQITSESTPYMINVRAPMWSKRRVLQDYAVGFQLVYKINTGSC